MVRNEVVVAVAGVPRAVAARGEAAKVEIAAADEAAAAPVVPAVVITAAVADSWSLLAMQQEGLYQERVHHECTRCLEFGHEESTSSSHAMVLAMELPMSEQDLAMEAQAFVAKETSKCSVMVGEEVEGGELGKLVVQYLADSVATCNMTPDADGLTNYQECSRPLGLANGETTSIAGYGDLTVAFRSDNG